MRIFRFHVWLKEDTEEFPKTIVFYWDWGCRKKHMYLLVIQHSYDPLSPIPFGQALTRSSHAAHVVCCCVTATHHIAKQLCCRKLPQGLKGGKWNREGWTLRCYGHAALVTHQNTTSQNRSKNIDDPLSPIPFGQALTRSSHAAHVVCCCVTATHHIAKQLCCRKLPVIALLIIQDKSTK